MRFAYRQRRIFACLSLGTWVFSLFVGIAHARSPGQPMASHEGPHRAMAGHQGHAATSPECVKFCNDATPLTVDLRSVQDQPAGQPSLSVVAILKPFDTGVYISPTIPSQRPPSVPLYLRVLRLAM